MAKTKTETITETQRMTLVGLFTLAGQLETEWRRVERAAMAITGQTELGGHTSDAIWEGSSDPVAAANSLLERLEITVVPDKAEPCS